MFTGLVAYRRTCWTFVGLGLAASSRSSRRSRDAWSSGPKGSTPPPRGPSRTGSSSSRTARSRRWERTSPCPRAPRSLTAVIVIPGLIDVHSHVGVYSVPVVEENYDGNEATNPVTPQVRALDSFNFDDPAIPAARAAGVTTVVSRPGSLNVIGGTSVAVKMKKASPAEMIAQGGLRPQDGHRGQSLRLLREPQADAVDGHGRLFRGPQGLHRSPGIPGELGSLREGQERRQGRPSRPRGTSARRSSSGS